MAPGNIYSSKGYNVRYGALAPIYDRIMSHVEYDEWILLLQKIAKKHIKKDAISIFELGGGTGILGEKLINLGYKYIGSDYSYFMSREAIKRKLPFLCADARSLPIKKQFDIVLFLYDGINYLNSVDEYRLLFNQVADCMEGGGIFLFDITTEYNSVNHFYDILDYEDYDDCSVIRHSYYNELTTTQHNDFTIFAHQKNTEFYKKFTDKHEQKVFPPQMIEEVIPGSKFDIVGIWDDFKMKKYTSRSERIHFCLRRK